MCYNVGMNFTRVSARAKINFTLDVLGKSNGYHTIDSLVCTIALCDMVYVSPRRDGKINMYMSGMGSETIRDADNTAYRAAKLFRDRFGTTGADITIKKEIPIGAGLGGSSADAAGVLKGLSQLYRISDMDGLKSIANEVGSDTAYLLMGGFARLEGRGDQFKRLRCLPRLSVVIVRPRTGGVSTASCFAAYDDLGKTYAPTTQQAVKALLDVDFERACTFFGNHLFEAAAVCDPGVRAAYRALKDAGAECVVMSGAGNACFAFSRSMQKAKKVRNHLEGDFDVIETSVMRLPLRWPNAEEIGAMYGRKNDR